MRKTQTRITLLVMALVALLVAPVAQAQTDANFAEVKLFTTPEAYAREGGKNEAAGSILLNASAADASRTVQQSCCISPFPLRQI